MTTTSQYFAHLACRVLELWKRRDYNTLAFPDIATQVLIENLPSANVSFTEAVRHGLFTDPLPTQQDLAANFGQPPLTVYFDQRFRIELLFWVVGLPAIHQHGFSGAFHVLHGSSLHSVWTFEKYKEIATRLLYGRLQFRGVEVLDTGAVRPIVGGGEFIHSTYHLDRPSVSLVIRTNEEAEHFPQYAYLSPCIAHNPFESGDAIQRQRQLLRMLSSTESYTELADLLAEGFEYWESAAVFSCLLQLPSLLPDKRLYNDVVMAAYVRHRELVECVTPALDEMARRDRIIGLRKATSNPDVQFFLAVLLNIPQKEAILEIVGRRYPKRSPGNRVALWIHELSSLGLLDGALQHLSVQCLEEIVEGRPDPANGGFTPEERQARTTLQSHWLLGVLAGGALQCGEPAAPKEIRSVDVCSVMPGLQEVVSRPHLYPLAVDFTKARIILVPMCKDNYEASSFLDHRTETASAQRYDASVADLLVAFKEFPQPDGPVNLILHGAFCCSTLLARYLQLRKDIHVLKEPYVLTQIAMATRKGSQDNNHLTGGAFGWSRYLELVIRLLQRRYAPSESVVIKVNDICNCLGGEILSLDSRSRGIFVVSDLRTFLFNVLKSAERRRWLRGRLVWAQNDAAAFPYLKGIAPAQLSDPEASAYLWAVNRAIRWRLCGLYPSQMLTLQDHEIAEMPRETIALAYKHFGMSDVRECADPASLSDVSAKHAKARSRAYGVDERREERVRLEGEIGSQVDRAVQWAEQSGIGEAMFAEAHRVNAVP